MASHLPVNYNSILHGSEGGVKALMRSGLLLSFLFLLPVLLVLAANFQNIDMHYARPLLPSFPEDYSFLVRSSYYKNMFAYVGGFMFLGLVPSNVSYSSKAIYISLLVLLPMYLLSVYIPILTLGEETARQFQFPFIITTDAVEIDWQMFDRITMFLVLGLVAFTMLFIAMLMWMFVDITRLSIIDIKPGIILLLIDGLIFAGCMGIPDMKSLYSLFDWTWILWGI